MYRNGENFDLAKNTWMLICLICIGPLRSVVRGADIEQERVDFPRLTLHTLHYVHISFPDNQCIVLPLFHSTQAVWRYSRFA
jgi:hypothetical protein